MTSALTSPRAADGVGPPPETRPRPLTRHLVPLSWALAGAVLPGLFALWHVSAHPRSFAHDAGIVILAVVGGLFLTQAFHDVSRHVAARVAAVALGGVLIAGFLNRERFLPDVWPVVSIALAVIAMQVAAAITAGGPGPSKVAGKRGGAGSGQERRWQRRWQTAVRRAAPWADRLRGSSSGLPSMPGIILLLLVAPVALLAPWFHPITSSWAGAAPAELLRYLLFGLVTVAVLARTAPASGAARTPRAYLDQLAHFAWAPAAPIGLLIATGDVGSAAVLAIGIVTLLLVARYWTAAGATALLAALAGLCCALAPGLVGHTGERNGKPDGLPALDDGHWHDTIWNNARLIEARLGDNPAGPLATSRLPSDGNWVDREFPLVRLVEQYGQFPAVVVALTAAALIGALVFLVASASGSDGAVVPTAQTRPNQTRAVAAGLVAMLAAGLALPGLALLLGVPRFGTAVPLLTGGPLSLILALASIGVVLGAAARPPGRPATRRPSSVPAGRGTVTPAEANIQNGAPLGRRRTGRDAGRVTPSFRGLTAALVAALVAAVMLTPLGGFAAEVYLVRSADGKVVGIEYEGAPRELALPPALSALVGESVPSGESTSITLDWRIQGAAEKALGEQAGSLVVLELPPVTENGRPSTLRAAAEVPTRPGGSITDEVYAPNLAELLYRARSEIPQDSPPTGSLAPGAETVLRGCVPSYGDPPAMNPPAADGTRSPLCSGTQNLSSLDAAALAALLVDPGQPGQPGQPARPWIPCPAVMTGPSCSASDYSGLRRENQKALYDQMGRWAVGNASVVYATVREGRAIWLIGGITAKNRSWSFAAYLKDPSFALTDKSVIEVAKVLAEIGQS